MRIGILIPGVDQTSGGAFTFEYNILNSIIKKYNNENIYIFSYNPIDCLEKTKINFVRLKRLKTIVAKWRINKELLKSNYYISILDKEVKTRKIDILWCPSQLFEVVEIPYIFTVWDLDHRVYPFFPEVSLGGEWEDRDIFYKKIIEKATFVICGTEVGKSEITNFYNLSKDRVKALSLPVPNLTDAIIKDKVYKKPFNTQYLFYPATFYPHKNHIRILQALIILEEKYNIKFNAVFVGNDGGNKEYIKNKCSELGLTERVLILNFVSIDELVYFYKNAFALIFASYFGPDNLPPLEAFSLKCPVVASDVDGASEQLKDNAILVDPNSGEEFADAIYKLYSDEEFRLKIINKAYASVNKWTFDDYVDKVFSLINSFEKIREVWGDDLKFFYRNKNITSKIFKKIFPFI